MLRQMEHQARHGDGSTLSRRLLVQALAAGAAWAALAADTPIAPPPTAPPAEGGEWRLVYVGAEDCAPCNAWRRRHWAELVSSARYAHITFLEVRAPRIAELLGDAYWPAPVRRHRTAIPPGAGAPFWLLLNGEDTVLRAWGEPQWRARMLPALRRAGRTGPPYRPITQDPGTGRRAT